jgi:uncharacterized membrane protein YdjX (TVP38/TMEM64 family)
MHQEPLDSPLPAIPERSLAPWFRRHASRLNWAGRVVGATAAYAVCWASAYTLVNQDFDWDLMVQYFVLAWSGNAFERPFFTWLLSVLMFLAFVVAWSVVAWRKRLAPKRAVWSE